MKLTPLDIHHKEFRNSIRGYNQEEVDQFLDEVADEFERLFKENVDLSERLDAAMEKVRSYADMEKTLHNTMLAAQQSAEDVKAKASKEADSLLKDAEIKAKELVQAALAEKQKTQAEFMRIKQAEDEFRMAFRNVLERYMRELHSIPIDADVATLIGVGNEPDAEPAAAPVPEEAFAEAAVSAAASEPVEAPAPEADAPASRHRSSRPRAASCSRSRSARSRGRTSARTRRLSRSRTSSASEGGRRAANVRTISTSSRSTDGGAATAPGGGRRG
jgi:cell division initiation protein